MKQKNQYNSRIKGTLKNKQLKVAQTVDLNTSTRELVKKTDPKTMRVFPYIYIKN